MVLILTPIELDAILRKVLSHDGVRLEVSGRHLPEIILGSGDKVVVKTTITEQDLESWQHDLLGKHERGEDESTIVTVFDSQFSVAFHNHNGQVALFAERI